MALELKFVKKKKKKKICACATTSRIQVLVHVFLRSKFLPNITFQISIAKLI